MLEKLMRLLFGTGTDEHRNLGANPKDLSQDGLIEFQEAVAGASAPLFAKKDPAQCRTFLSQYQSSSSACVAFTIAKIAQILFYLRRKRKIKFSPGWIYRQRSPKEEGMNISNVIKLASEGMIPEELYPSENLTEAQMNALKDESYGKGVAEEFAVPPDWVNVPLDFDIVASTIEKTEKGIMLWFRFGVGEWFRKEIPTIITTSIPYCHSVTAVDAFTYNGQQYILVEDSADKTFNQRKLITRAFFRRCILARYPLRFKFDPVESLKPKYDGSVSSLQDCLTYEGLFPSNISSRGYYGTITKKAVLDFQAKYGIDQVGVVGPITTAKLKELYP